MTSHPPLWSYFDMLTLPIGPLLGYAHQLSVLGQLAQVYLRDNKPIQMASVEHKKLRSNTESFIECCQNVGLIVTKGLAQDVLAEIDGAWSVPATGFRVFDYPILIRLENKLSAVTHCLKKEAETKRVMVLSPEKAALYDPAEPHFGPEVRNKFPRAIPEIDEAAKCLALGRSTASMFHLMRASELVLRAIHSCLGLPPPNNPNWVTWLTPIREERLKRNKGGGWAENDFFQDVWQRLDSIKDAQRNSTMHVESIYTEAEADLIFRITDGFMKKVASRMDENGQPLA